MDARHRDKGVLVGLWDDMSVEAIGDLYAGMAENGRDFRRRSTLRRPAPQSNLMDHV